MHTGQPKLCIINGIQFSSLPPRFVAFVLAAFHTGFNVYIGEKYRKELLSLCFLLFDMQLTLDLYIILIIMDMCEITRCAKHCQKQPAEPGSFRW